MYADERRATVPLTAVEAGRMVADFAAMTALAALYETRAAQMLDWAGLGAHTVANHDLVASAMLSPATCAEAEAAVLLATGQLAGHAAWWKADATAVRAAEEALRLADRAAAGLSRSADWSLGCVAGQMFGHDVGAVAVLGALAWQAMPAGARREAGDAVSHDVSRFAAGHPGLTQHLIAAAPGFLAGVGVPLGVGMTAAAASAARAYGPETGERTERRPDLRVAETQRAPQDVADVVEHLGELSDLSDGSHPENDGTIEIQRLIDADGDRRWVVYLPGTDDMNPLHGTGDGDVRDMAENLRLEGDVPTAYAAGIVDAMHQAGIGPDDPVMLAGHSQGGMEAEAIASSDSGFHVTQIVTAGSPAVPEPLPASVHALQLEHDGDLVPALDGRDNTASPQHVTVRFDSGVDGIVENHDFTHYTLGAAAVDASDDPALVAQVGGMRAEGFLGADGAHGEIFQITRTH
jgi:hypothetical protein